MKKPYNFTLKWAATKYGDGSYAYAVVDGKVFTTLPGIVKAEREVVK